MKISELYLVAWMATEKELPAESKKLIEDHDRLFDDWRKAGFGSVPAELQAASDAIEKDPLARIPFDLRQKCNQAAAKEYAAEKEAL